MKNKKGMAYDLLMWVPKIGLLIFVLTTIVLLIKASLIDQLYTGSLESSIVVNRLIYSPDTLAYKDGLGRVYPGIIDYSKFSEDNINKALDYGKNKFGLAFKLELKNLVSGKLDEIYYNRFFYDIAEPLAWSNKYNAEITSHYILIKNNGKLTKGLLTAKVVLPK